MMLRENQEPKPPLSKWSAAATGRSFGNSFDGNRHNSTIVSTWLLWFAATMAGPSFGNFFLPITSSPNRSRAIGRTISISPYLRRIWSTRRSYLSSSRGNAQH